MTSLCKNGMQGAPARRPLWKALADTGRADYFRWTFRTGDGTEIVLSVGKAWRNHGDLRHSASADTCEALLWLKTTPRIDRRPEEISCLLEPWSRYWTGEAGGAIALNMPDSILIALLFALDYYYEETQHKATLLNAFRKVSA